MTITREPDPDFLALAKRAMRCADQWRLWANCQPEKSKQRDRALTVAGYFTLQATQLQEMYMNRVEIAPIATTDLETIKPQPR